VPAIGALSCAFNRSSKYCKRRSNSLVSIARSKMSTTAAILPASPGAITPLASAEVTAFIAGAISAGLLIGGNADLTARSRAHRQDAFDA
jgi:hypothetical protein